MSSNPQAQKIITQAQQLIKDVVRERKQFEDKTDKILKKLKDVSSLRAQKQTSLDKKFKAVIQDLIAKI